MVQPVFFLQPSFHKLPKEEVIGKFAELIDKNESTKNTYNLIACEDVEKYQPPHLEDEWLGVRHIKLDISFCQRVGDFVSSLLSGLTGARELGRIKEPYPEMVGNFFNNPKDEEGAAHVYRSYQQGRYIDIYVRKEPIRAYFALSSGSVIQGAYWLPYYIQNCFRSVILGSLDAKLNFQYDRCLLLDDLLHYKRKLSVIKIEYRKLEDSSSYTKKRKSEALEESFSENRYCFIDCFGRLSENLGITDKRMLELALSTQEEEEEILKKEKIEKEKIIQHQDGRIEEIAELLEEVGESISHLKDTKEVIGKISWRSTLTFYYPVWWKCANEELTTNKDSLKNERKGVKKSLKECEDKIKSLSEKLNKCKEKHHEGTKCPVELPWIVKPRNGSWRRQIDAIF